MWGVFNDAGRLLGGFDLFCDAVKAFGRWPTAESILPVTHGLIK